MLKRGSNLISPARDDIAVIPVRRVKAYQHVGCKQEVDQVAQDGPAAVRANTQRSVDTKNETARFSRSHPWLALGLQPVELWAQAR